MPGHVRYGEVNKVDAVHVEVGGEPRSGSLQRDEGFRGGLSGLPRTLSAGWRGMEGRSRTGISGGLAS